MIASQTHQVDWPRNASMIETTCRCCDWNSAHTQDKQNNHKTNRRPRRQHQNRHNQQRMFKKFGEWLWPTFDEAKTYVAVYYEPFCLLCCLRPTAVFRERCSPNRCGGFSLFARLAAHNVRSKMLMGAAITRLKLHVKKKREMVSKQRHRARDEAHPPPPRASVLCAYAAL